MELRLKKTSRKSIYGKSRFIDLDVCWIGTQIMKIRPTKSIADYTITFKGKVLQHPWNGQERLDGLFTTGINFMREHVKPSVRMHYVYKMEAKFLM
jgi:aminobenzoyl-glutamate utilization protein B